MYPSSGFYKPLPILVIVLIIVLLHEIILPSRNNVSLNLMCAPFFFVAGS